MPLECTMVCLDTSEYMRNGDFGPSRLESQQDAANLVVGAKMQSNPESSVGVLQMSEPRVLVSPTDDMGKILGSLSEASVQGHLNLVEGVQVAQLALKHRRNKNGGQRLVLFVGSPIVADEKALVKAAKVLKKNNIAVDVVQMGNDAQNSVKLKAFVDAAISNENSHLVSVPPGVVLSDVLISSPIVQGEGGTTNTGMAGNQEFPGVDANLDPELALALRVSMEEERARQQRAASGGTNNDTSKEDDPPIQEHPVQDEENEDTLLQRALEMSMMEAQQSEAQQSDAQQSEVQQSSSMEIDSNQNKDQPIPEPQQNVQQQQSFYDPNFVNQMLSQLPGVDPSDPAIQEALSRIQGGANTADSEKKDGDEDTSSSAK
mmetsp:Transcript_19629/g.25418  ORF Transcript_19629/g.25418 Transcript_19629/m.25418 type:complete len:375 (+) Transcript_19629:56-1180(+)